MTVLGKHCNSCNLHLTLDLFGKDKYGKLGVTDYCRSCRNINARERAKIVGYTKRNEKYKEQRREYYKKPEVLDKLRNKWFTNTYGITIQNYYDMLMRQNFKCAICCVKHEEEKLKRLTVDHCHKTNKLRKLLCNVCNRALGLFKDNHEILLSAAKYIEENR